MFSWGVSWVRTFKRGFLGISGSVLLRKLVMDPSDLLIR